MPIHQTPVHLAKIKGGKIVEWLNKTVLSMWLSSLPDGLVEVEIIALGQRRSKRQNRYLWGAYYKKIADAFPDIDIASFHEYCREEFLTYEVKEVLGKEVKIYKSTSRLTKKEFTEYIEKISERTGITPPDTKKYNL